MFIGFTTTLAVCGLCVRSHMRRCITGRLSPVSGVGKKGDAGQIDTWSGKPGFSVWGAFGTYVRARVGTQLGSVL